VLERSSFTTAPSLHGAGHAAAAGTTLALV
jgi:hypothetical protein